MFTFGTIVNEKWENLESGDGFSVNQFGRSPQNGYMVGIPGYETIIPESVLTFEIFVALFQKYTKILCDIADYDLFFGAWCDSGKIYFDVSLNVDSLNDAIELGKNYNQLAIFDLSTFESITL